jgi:hypothetical protein
VTAIVEVATGFALLVARRAFNRLDDDGNLTGETCRGDEEDRHRDNR